MVPVAPTTILFGGYRCIPLHIDSRTLSTCLIDKHTLHHNDILFRHSLSTGKDETVSGSIKLRLRWINTQAGFRSYVRETLEDRRDYLVEFQRKMKKLYSACNRRDEGQRGNRMRSSHSVNDTTRNRRAGSIHASSSSSTYGPPLPSQSHHQHASTSTSARSSNRGGVAENKSIHNHSTDRLLPSAGGGASLTPLIVEEEGGDEEESSSRYPRNSYVSTDDGTATGTTMMLAPPPSHTSTAMMSESGSSVLTLRRPEETTGDHPHHIPHHASLHPPHLLSEIGKYDDDRDDGGVVASELLSPYGKATGRMSLTPRSIGGDTTDDDGDRATHASSHGIGEEELEEERLLALIGHDENVPESDDGLHMMASIRKRFSEVLSMGTCC